MKICIIGSYFPPDIGANSTQAWNLSRILSEKGHQVTVVTAFPHYPDGKIPKNYLKRFFVKEYPDRVKVFRVWVPPLVSEGFVKRLVIFASFTVSHFVGLFLVPDYDLIFAVGPWPPSPFTIPAYFHGGLKRKPVVIYQVDSVLDTLLGAEIIKGKTTKALLKIVCTHLERRADGIITYTESLKNLVLERGISKNKIYVIPLPVDTDIFKPLGKNFVSGFPKFKDKFIVMYSGILSPHYDFDSLIEAAHLLRHNDKILFVIRGAGELQRKIQRNIERLQLSNVVLLGRVTNQTSVAELLNAADVLVVPMSNLSVWAEVVIPSKINEYLSCGKPVICCGKGETAKLLNDNKVGITVESENPEQLAQAVLTLFSNDQLRVEMQQNARNFAVKNLSLKGVGERIETAFLKVIKESK